MDDFDTKISFEYQYVTAIEWGDQQPLQLWFYPTELSEDETYLFDMDSICVECFDQHNNRYIYVHNPGYPYSGHLHNNEGVRYVVLTIQPESMYIDDFDHLLVLDQSSNKYIDWISRNYTHTEGRTLSARAYNLKYMPSGNYKVNFELSDEFETTNWTVLLGSDGTLLKKAIQV